MAPAIDKIRPFGDPRVSHGFIKLRDGITYHYLYGVPSSGFWRATIFLIHGWPDLSYGWRYQIPLLLSLGLRVVAPDMMGYGCTDAPDVPPNDLSLYGLKRASDDIAELAKALAAPKIVIAGHDWGGLVVYRCAEWHPELVTHVISVATPYIAPNKKYLSLDDVISRLPHFGYQKHLASGEIERMIATKDQIRTFLNTVYGGRSATGKIPFDPIDGVHFDVLPSVGKSPLVSDEEMDYYVDQFARNGFHGPCNWYRTRKVNWEDELNLHRPGTDLPVLFIICKRDSVLLPAMAQGMEQHLPNVVIKEVNAAHWALWQTPTEVNALMKAWIEEYVFNKPSGETSKL